VPAIYLDTSALGRMLFDEPDAAAIERSLESFDQRISSRLLGTELRRIGFRADRLGDADRLLATVGLIELDDGILTAAETTPPKSVATLDAIHLATALRLAGDGILDTVMTYDKQLAAGAREHDLTVLAPT
jgi:predicted nucleic acid-binding protein